MSTVIDCINLLKYANIQVAAEAFLIENDGKPIFDKNSVKGRLEKGNAYNIFFTETSAAKFAEEWTIVDQQPNTSSGFSATLFRNKTTNEYVVSFRSTEFIHDYIHDNFVTNRCISEHGWAFAQISDMIEWWENKIEVENIKEVTVTGYSLGGHLANAFAMLYSDKVKNVYTFNGAGTGLIDGHSEFDYLVNGETDNNKTGGSLRSII